jgi:hypothetical protein
MRSVSKWTARYVLALLGRDLSPLYYAILDTDEHPMNDIVTTPCPECNGDAVIPDAWERLDYEQAMEWATGG